MSNQPCWGEGKSDFFEARTLSSRALWPATEQKKWVQRVLFSKGQIQVSWAFLHCRLSDKSRDLNGTLFTLVQGDAGELPLGGESREAGCENVVCKKDFQISPYEKHIINKYHQMRHISSLTNIIWHQVRRPCTVSRQGWGCGHHWIPCAAPWSNHPLLWDANICNLVTKTFIYGSLRSCAPANIQNLTRPINVVRKVQIRLTYGSCLIVNTCFLARQIVTTGQEPQVVRKFQIRLTWSDLLVADGLGVGTAGIWGR